MQSLHFYIYLVIFLCIISCLFNMSILFISLVDSEKDESESPQSRGKIALVLPPPKFNDSFSEEVEDRSESDISRELEEDKSSEQTLFVIGKIHSY